jgi:hypothetical protein
MFGVVQQEEVGLRSGTGKISGEKFFGVGPNASRAASVLAGLYESEQELFLPSTTTKINSEATRHPTTKALQVTRTRTKATNT